MAVCQVLPERGNQTREWALPLPPLRAPTQPLGHDASTLMTSSVPSSVTMMPQLKTSGQLRVMTYSLWQLLVLLPSSSSSSVSARILHGLAFEQEQDIVAVQATWGEYLQEGKKVSSGPG